MLIVLNIMVFGFFWGSKISILGGRNHLNLVWVKGVMGRNQGGHGFDEKSMFMRGVASQGTEVNPF